MAKSFQDNPVLRLFHLHSFIYLYNILMNQNHIFSAPKFKLFMKKESYFKEGKYQQFFNILWTFKTDLIYGSILTILFATLNLLVPQFIKMFLHFMHEHHSQKSDVNASTKFLKTFIFVQVFRIIFGEHMKRVFREIAIKAEATLAKRLVQKSILLAKDMRDQMPHSAINQLENIDLKLIYNLLQNLYLLVQAPFTVIVAMGMLFFQRSSYGIIGIYWLLIIFLIQRQLDEKMTHCNQTKLGLIQQRSKANYQLIHTMPTSKLIGWSDVIVEKNNDYFEEQNEDHLKFYTYSSYSDISLLMLPVLVVISICIYDMNQPNPITVEQVYLMLSLLGIAYTPLKSFRQLSLNIHDGLHSFHRFEAFFKLHEERVPNFLSDFKKQQNTLIRITKNTTAVYPHATSAFILKINRQIRMHRGQRVYVLGPAGHGRTSFISIFVGLINIVDGSIYMNRSKISYMPSNNFFLKGKIIDNIRFYDQKIPYQKIESLSYNLGLQSELKSLWGLQTQMDYTVQFTQAQLKKISLIRTLSQQADIYIFDQPFNILDEPAAQNLNKIFREYEGQGKLIMFVANKLRFASSEDRVMVIQQGIVQVQGLLKDIIANQQQDKIENYYTGNDKFLLTKEQQQEARHKQLIHKFQRGVNKVVAFQALSKMMKHQQKRQTDIQKLSLVDIQKAQQLKRKKIERSHKLYTHQQFWKYFKKYLQLLPISESIFIILIIAFAEFLHVFIHFFIGHLEEDHGAHNYLKFRSMIVIEVILTLGLAAVLYFEGEISSYLVMIQSNQIYEKSLTSLSNKSLTWFTENYEVKVADIYNHDYEEIFIAAHTFLSIYKNIVVLLITINFISSDKLTIVLAFILLSVIYISIFYIFQKASKKLIKYYYTYKYIYVQILDDSIRGADLFKIFRREQKILKRAEKAYTHIANYKIAQTHILSAMSMACDCISVIILSSLVFYGLKFKMHEARDNIPLIATSIHLLLNGSQLLKGIVKDSVNFFNFFTINIIPIMEIGQQDEQSNHKKVIPQQQLDIVFDHAVLKSTDGLVTCYPLNLKIKQGQKILIYEQSDRARAILVQALTLNFSIVDQEQKKNQGSIKIGGVQIHDIYPKYYFEHVGLILNKNFYMSGNLIRNIVHKEGQQNLYEILKYVKLLGLHEQIEDFNKNKLASVVQFDTHKVNHHITKKIALLRILVQKPKIVIIKDTSSYIGKNSIIQILQKYNKGCTVIKIGKRIEQAMDVKRIVYSNFLKICQDGSPQELQRNENSKIGKLLQQKNQKDANFILRAFIPKKKSPMSLLIPQFPF